MAANSIRPLWLQRTAREFQVFVGAASTAQSTSELHSARDALLSRLPPPSRIAEELALDALASRIAARWTRATRLQSIEGGEATRRAPCLADLHRLPLFVRVDFVNKTVNGILARVRQAGDTDVPQAGQDPIPCPSSACSATNDSKDAAAASGPLASRPSENVWASFRRLSQACSFPAGATVLEQGQAVRFVLLVDRGIVKLTRREHNGGEVIIGWRFPGSLVGVAPALSGQPCPWFAETTAPARFYRLDTEELSRLLRRQGDLWVEILRLEGEDLCSQVTQIGLLACEPARVRLKSLLGDLSRSLPVAFRGGPNDRVRLPLKRLDLARAIAVTPETLSRLIRAFEREGLVRRDKGWLTVAAADKLALRR